MKLEACEVAVVGGGPAGACAAAALAHRSVPVILLEMSREPARKPGEFLPPEAAAILNALGGFAGLAGGQHLPCHGTAFAWGTPELQENDYLLQPKGAGWQLARMAFEKYLLELAEEVGAEVARGCPLQDIARERGRWILKTRDREIHCGLVIDATGRRAHVARKLGVKRKPLDRLVAIHNIAHSAAHADGDSRTFVEAERDGWWYSALIPEGQRVFVFVTDADLVRPREWLPAAWLIGRLRRTRCLSQLFAQHGYRMETASRLTSAHIGRLQELAGPCWVAIGDAAMSFDPLSGQGILKAMRTGVAAAEVLCGNGSISTADLQAQQEEEWNQHLKRRFRHYTRENRWPNAVFWRRRSRPD